LGIYVGYDSPSIIKYLEPSIGDLFTARFADSHFDELVFPTLRGERNWKRILVGMNYHYLILILVQKSVN